MRLREVKRAISALNTRQLVKLDAWLHGLMETTERVGGRKPEAELYAGHRNYQQEMVRCGKKGCRCSRGELHAPTGMPTGRRAGGPGRSTSASTCLIHRKVPAGAVSDNLM